jgi:D-serine dehydratase
VGELGLSLLAGDLLMPAMTIRGDVLQHNLHRMMRFCHERGVKLAPHGKTTMAPQLFADQLEAGAWAMTAATVGQAQVMRRHGVQRILIANEVVGPRAIRWMADALSADSELELYCLADSPQAVDLLERELDEADAERPLGVLVELGLPGMRGGHRNDDSALATLRLAARRPHLTVAGVECFEGVVGPDAGKAPLVRKLLSRLASVVSEAAREGLFDGAGRVIVSAGGSVFFDHVAELASLDLALPFDVVLRSGCYVTHDHGAYDRASPLGSGRGAPDPLRPALALWAEVQSHPEPGLAIAGFGRRDAPYDAGLPRATGIVRGGFPGVVEPLRPGDLTVTRLNDQHAFLAADLEVGDVLSFGISHPCTAFDKWRTVLEVDPAYRVTRAIRTFF